MWLPLLGLILGISLGLLSDIQIPEVYDNYLSIAVLAALDTLIWRHRAHLQQVYDDKVFVSGFFFNIALAAALAFLGVHLGVDLYLGCNLCIRCSVIPKYCCYQKDFTCEMVRAKQSFQYKCF